MDRMTEMQKMIASSRNLPQKVSTCTQVFLNAESSDSPEELIRDFAMNASVAWFPKNREKKSQETQDSEVEGLLSALEAEEKVTGNNSPEELHTNILLNDSDISFYMNEYSKLVEGFIDYYSAQGFDEIKYYSKIWSAFSRVISDVSNGEKGIVLFLFLRDQRTPYYNLGIGRRMSNEQFDEISERLTKQIDQLLFAFSLNDSQKTELASRVLTILDRIEMSEDRLVFMCHLIEYAKQKGYESFFQL